MNEFLQILSKKYKMIKKENYYIYLEYCSSLRYSFSASYKSRIDSLITRPEKQLSLDFNHDSLGYDLEVQDVSTLGKVHALNLRRHPYLTDVSVLCNLHKLNLSRCVGISDVSALGNLYELDLR
jgi:hypothetical protein